VKNFIEGLYLVRPKNEEHSSREHLVKNLKKGIKRVGRLWERKKDLPYTMHREYG
jgi:hypothetical protein